MENGEWGMGKNARLPPSKIGREWGMATSLFLVGEWGMRFSVHGMGNGKWRKGNGFWECSMVIGKW